MTTSGESSIRNYECGSPPLIRLYEALVETEGVYGARFSGAGFRGCCVALVETSMGPAIAERITAAYAASHPELAEHAATFLCESADGAAVDPGPPPGRSSSIDDPYPLVRVP
jgi:galactokinase